MSRSVTCHETSGARVRGSMAVDVGGLAVDPGFQDAFAGPGGCLEVGRVAHSFKGACANLGALRAAEAARLLERAGHDNDGSEMARWIDDLNLRFAEARDALQALVPQPHK